MRSRWLLPSILAVLALNGCSGQPGSNGESEGSRESEILERLAELDTGPKWDIASRDGSLMALLPQRWREVPDLFPQALLTVASGPVTGRVIGPCYPGAVLDELPEGGALVRISEMSPPVRREVASRPYPPRPRHFRLGRPELTNECGSSYELRFRQGARNLAVSVWTRPVAEQTGPLPEHPVRGSWPKLGRLSPIAGRQLLGLLDGLRVQPAAAEPIRVPFLALDCRNPPNALGCDRVRAHVDTRVKMKHLSVRINRWSARTPDGWVFSERVISRPTALTAAGTSGSVAPVPVGSMPRTIWTGVIPRAGLRGGGAAFRRALPGPGERWIGASPRIRADLEVIAPGGRWNFRQIEMIAGYG